MENIIYMLYFLILSLRLLVNTVCAIYSPKFKHCKGYTGGMLFPFNRLFIPFNWTFSSFSLNNG